MVPQTSVEVTIDCPFIFFIRDIKTETMLFVGRLVLQKYSSLCIEIDEPSSMVGFHSSWLQGPRSMLHPIARNAT